MTIYRSSDATLSDSAAIVEVINRARLTWTVYFPCPETRHVDAFIEFAIEQPKYSKAILVKDGNRILGGLGMSLESIANLTIAHNQLLFVEPDLSAIEKYRVIYTLINTIKPWLKEQNVHRIAWTLGVGKWKSLQRIINRAFPSTQVGVCINSELS